MSGTVDILPSRIPILGLVDADPYGLDILSVYKYGSYATAHEGDTLTAPRIELLGVKITELQGYGDQVLRRAAHRSSFRMDIPTNKILPLKSSDEAKVCIWWVFMLSGDGFSVDCSLVGTARTRCTRGVAVGKNVSS